MIDLEVYRKGAWALLHGRDPYGAGLPGPRLPYTYTPFSTLLWVPLDLIPLHAAMLLGTGASLVALFVALAVFSGRVLPWRVGAGEWLAVTGVLTAVAFFSEPVLQTLGFGQVNLVLMAIVAFDLLGPSTGRWQGALTGVAAGIKLTPLVFVLYLLVTGRRRAAGVAAATAAATVAIGGLVLPGPSRHYFTDLMWNSGRVGRVWYVGNQSLDGMWARLLGETATAHLLWLASAAAVTALGMWTARRLRSTLSEPAGVAACAVTGLLVSPISWSHHWVWWVLPAVVLAHLAWRTRSWVAAGLALAWSVTFYVGPFWFLPHVRTAPPAHAPGTQLLASAYVWVALGALIGTAWWAARSRGLPVAEEPAPAPSPRPATA
jgi:alpha-1,2-mannosyltransferase